MPLTDQEKSSLENALRAVDTDLEAAKEYARHLLGGGGRDKAGDVRLVKCFRRAAYVLLHAAEDFQDELNFYK